MSLPDLEFAQDWAPAPGTGSSAAPFTGAGDNAFAALISPQNAPDPRPPDLVHFRGSFEQVAIVRLKIAAVRALPVQSVRSFFGLGHFGRRVWFYHELRTALPTDVRTFWDQREPRIRSGLLASGRVERSMEQFRTRILPLVHARATIDALLACSTLPEQQAFIAERWRTRRWSVLRRAHPLAAAIDAALTEGPVGYNFRLQWRLLGAYPDLERGPPWLTTAGHATLRQRLDWLEVASPVSHGR